MLSTGHTVRGCKFIGLTGSARTHSKTENQGAKREKWMLWDESSCRRQVWIKSGVILDDERV